MLNEYIVSACLAGAKCSYDGRGRLNEEIFALVQEGRAIAICPEVMAGLPVPRIPAEILGASGEDVLDGRARVITKDGRDVTDKFLKAALLFVEAAKSKGIKRAILKAKSPSCGVGQVYDGSFEGRLIQGDGVTAALLKREGIEVEVR
ncbi:MAG: DUF523 domain-containing protein [Actinomycetota bacterium]|nr:DUF523 domain-containing protein [Actinomycetota bacterium]